MNTAIVNLTRFPVNVVVHLDRSGRLRLHAQVASLWDVDDAGQALLAATQPPIALKPMFSAKHGCDVLVAGSDVPERAVVISMRDAGGATVTSTDHMPGEHSATNVADAAIANVPLRAAEHAALFGTTDERWQRTRMPLPPHDFDARFNNDPAAALHLEVAPIPGATFTVNDVGNRPAWVVQLPAAGVSVTAHYAGEHCTAHAAAIDTLRLEPLASRLQITARAFFPLYDQGHALNQLEFRCE